MNKMKRVMRLNFLRKSLEKQSGEVLIIGCGSKGEMSILNRKCEGVGIDLSQTAIEKTKKDFPQFQYYVCDACNLPLPNSKFNCVVCSETIEHVENPQKLLKEVKRVLRKDGILVLTTPNWLSWYGLARKIAEIIFRRPFTADNQPIDHWTTPPKLRRKLEKDFEILSFQSLWFYPPTGKGNRRLPDLLVLPIFWLFYPIELFMRKILPWFGHIMIFEAKLK